jgi:hypothetical protein
MLNQRANACSCLIIRKAIRKNNYINYNNKADATALLAEAEAVTGGSRFTVRANTESS